MANHQELSTRYGKHNTERFIILGGSNIEPWVAEDEIFKMDRTAAVKWIASGELTDIHSVVGLDLTTGKSRDASEEIAKLVANVWALDGEGIDDWQRDYLEQNIGVSFANNFQQAAE